MSTRLKPWWMGPGPIALAAATLVACGVVVYQGVRSARQPVDVVDRNGQLVRAGAFCDAPSSGKSSAKPPTDK